MSNSRYKDGCFYCEHNDTQKERMIEVMPLHVSTFFINKDQTHLGRSVVALNRHADELFELSDIERNEFMTDIAVAAKTIKKLFNAEKINYGVYGDTVSHLHFHLVPKKSSDTDWDDAFINNPKNPKILADYNDLIEKITKELENYYEKI